MLNLTELEEEYKLEMQLQSKVKSTIRNYSKSIKKFIQLVGDLDVEKVAHKHNKQYFYTLKEKEYKNKTINFRITAIDIFSRVE